MQASVVTWGGVITVPSDVTSLRSFQLAGEANDPLGGVRIPQALLTSDLNASWNDILTGVRQNLIAVSNEGPLNIPVISGESLLVVIDPVAVGSALTVLWFE